MIPKTAGALADALKATELIGETIAVLPTDLDSADWRYIAAIERQFITIGEELTRIRDA